MRHTPEAGYYLHKKSAELLGEAKRLASDRRIPTDQSQRQLRDAQAIYNRILEEGASDAPELIPEAYKEYLALLREELLTAINEERFEDVEMLGKKMKELKAAYGGESVENSLEEDLLEFFEDQDITDEISQRRFRNRAQHLLEKQHLSRRAVMEQLNHELETERSDRTRTRTPKTGTATR